MQSAFYKISIFIVATFLLAHVATICHAEALTAAQDTTSNETPVKPVQPTELNNDPLLQVKISFEVKRRPVGELLVDLQQQSGIQLTMTPGSSTANMLVTARVKEMPLSKLLSALSRLYGVSWVKHDEHHYVMVDSDREALDVKLLPMGSANQANGNLIAARKKESANWAEEIMPNTDEKALRSPKGIAVTSLPEEVQRKLRHNFSQWIALDLLNLYFSASEVSLKEGSIHVETYGVMVPDPNPKNRRNWISRPLPSQLRLEIRASNGWPITNGLVTWPLKSQSPE